MWKVCAKAKPNDDDDDDDGGYDDHWVREIVREKKKSKLLFQPQSRFQNNIHTSKLANFVSINIIIIIIIAIVSRKSSAWHHGVFVCNCWCYQTSLPEFLSLYLCLSPHAALAACLFYFYFGGRTGPYFVWCLAKFHSIWFQSFRHDSTSCRPVCAQHFSQKS